MIRGVSFKIPQTRKNALWQILKCVDVEKYCWHNIESQDEIWDRAFEKAFFETNFYDGKSFSQHIRSNRFIISAKLQAYFKETKFYDIHTYEDFQKSDCQLLLLIYDCENVEVFVKEQIIVEALHNNALFNNYTEVEYITESNDGRTKMDVR